MTSVNGSSVALIAVPLLSAQFLPPLVLYLGFGTSLAEGTAIAALVTLSIFYGAQAISWRDGQRVTQAFDLSPLVLPALCGLAIVPHAAIADLLQVIDAPRLFKTAPLFVLLLASAMALGRMLTTASDRNLEKAIDLSFFILCAAIVLRVFGLEPRPAAFEKPLFPFTETSHFALAFVPVYFYRCVRATRRAALGWLIFGLVVAVCLQSLTLLIALVLAATICRRILLVSVAGAAAGAAIAPLAFDYFISRLDLSSSSSNLSSLVYIQGWQLLKEALINTAGWGVGFEQLGGHGTSAAAADSIFTLLQGSGLDALNLTDGSFVFAKLVGELGVFGLTVSAIFVAAAVRSVRKLRSIDYRNHERPVVIFARCILIAFLIDMFVRGTGYFVGSTLVAISAGTVLSKNTGKIFFRKKWAVT